MATRATEEDNLDPTDGEVDPDHDAYVRAKVLRALEQSRDRSVMTPIEQVWRDLSR